MKTYAVVGTGGRSLMMFAVPFAEELKPYAELVGVCDVNPVRAGLFGDKAGGAPVYADFDRMLKSGGDQLLRRMLFAQDKPDPLGQLAGSRASAMSMMIGTAANVSIAENRPIAIKDLLAE